MEQKLAQLKTLLGEAADLYQIEALLGWDQQVNMPPGSAESRAQQMATLGALAHQKATAPEIGQLLEELLPWAESLDPDSEDHRLIKVSAKDYDKATRVPAEFVAEASQVTAMAHQAWAKARAESNFAAFQPHLEKVLDLKHRYIAFFPPADHPYDTLLDDFEPGMKTADVKAIFEALRPQQVELIKAIAEKPPVDDSFMRLDYDETKQWEFGLKVASAFGYDWNRGRQDKSTHPFTTSFGMDDVRITTRVYKNQFATALFGTMHETGHALYEQGVGHVWARTPLASGTSLAVHESQSRMWENLVGRSLPFWEHFYPELQAAFPEQLGKVGLETFYKGINKVSPSYIRVEADEATYNLHIMLRLELEIALIEGSLAVKDLPQAWNAKMQDYLGLTPPNDTLGVLQDIHWSGGMVGYFSTYALGNLVSVQLWEKFKTINPEIDDQMRQGDFSNLLSWLRVKIHQHGRKYEPQELVQRVTGSKIDPAPYVRYLKEKYSAIYGL